MRPSLKTAMRSLIVSASSWSWVTKTKVMPTSRWICLSSTCISRRSLRSRAPSGSSSSSTLGRFTRARASATRWRWPPESWCGRRAAYPSSRTVASASSARRRRSALGDLLDPQPVLDVLEHAHVREDRVVLEDRVDVPVVRRPAGHVLVAELDGPGGRRLEARRSAGAPWSCRTRTARASRRTRRPRCPGRGRRRRAPGRSACSALAARWPARSWAPRRLFLRTDSHNIWNQRLIG